jgi:hypothetical protein
VLFLHVLAKISGGWGVALVSGIVAAFAALAARFWVLIKTTRRLSLRAVFLTTSAFLFLMGLKFIGEGLQEFPGAGTRALCLGPRSRLAHGNRPQSDLASTGGANGRRDDGHHRRRHGNRRAPSAPLGKPGDAGTPDH